MRGEMTVVSFGSNTSSPYGAESGGLCESKIKRVRDKMRQEEEVTRGHERRKTEVI